MSTRQRHFSMIRDFHLADFFTLANGASGMAAIFLAMEYVREPRPEKVYGAALLVVAALVFDVLDGRIARRRHVADIEDQRGDRSEEQTYERHAPGQLLCQLLLERQESAITH